MYNTSPASLEEGEERESPAGDFLSCLPTRHSRTTTCSMEGGRRIPIISVNASSLILGGGRTACPLRKPIFLI